MDSAERHELKENDLQGFLLNIRSFWDQYGMRIMLVVAVLSLLFAITSITTSRSRDRREQALTALATTSSPAAFREIALRYRNQPDVWAKAMLWGADGYLREASTAAEETPDLAPGEEATATPPARNEADRELSLDSALAMYRELANSSAAPLFRINALLGLGAAHESKTQWDDARQAYQQAQSLAGTTYQALAAQAAQRLEMLPHLTQALVFATEAPVEPAQATTESTDSADITIETTSPILVPDLSAFEGLQTTPQPSATEAETETAAPETAPAAE